MEILIAGASGGIGQALHQTLVDRGHRVLTISRRARTADFQVDTSQPDSVNAIRTWLEEEHHSPDLIIQCAGMLHDETFMPEKSLSRIDSRWLAKSMEANLLTSIHLSQAIDSLVTRSRPIRWVSLSALVGSISENRLGGWYSYRMSKAALNMFIKNLSIEWGRRSPNSIVAALHPGTTDTQLSQPFQKNIAEGKLYTQSLTASRLAHVIENLDSDQHGRLLHWDGSIVPF